MRREVLVKYLLLSFMLLLSLVLIGQLLAQLFTVKGFTKIRGKVASKNIETTGYSLGGRFKKGNPSKSLVLLVDNKYYNVDLLYDSDWDIDDSIKVGDSVTLYNSSKIYRILSLDGLDFGSRVSQVEVGGKVLYSFRHHQQRNWIFILFMTGALGVFGYMYYYNKKASLLRGTKQSL